MKTIFKSNFEEHTLLQMEKVFKEISRILHFPAFMLVSDLRCPINNNYLQSKLRLIKVGDLKISK
ncbi:hypothetical protein T4B_11210 [Trichinella pseudospiralis]|uniref:Uncharacterized protein n=1 Tax=Trichinella pseudospiralis TaxID=6337 RepID=A0A0V1IIJ8_TRIPS|nr:hypothetical protein T4B_11210 [Trichinella pseudospiralis]